MRPIKVFNSGSLADTRERDPDGPHVSGLITYCSVSPESLQSRAQLVQWFRGGFEWFSVRGGQTLNSGGPKWVLNFERGSRGTADEWSVLVSHFIWEEETYDGICGNMGFLRSPEINSERSNKMCPTVFHSFLKFT